MGTVTAMRREWGMTAIVREDTYLRPGSQVWILRISVNKARARVYGRNIEGRMVTKYVMLHRLTNWASAWVPPNPLLRQRLDAVWTAAPEAERYAHSLDEESRREWQRRQTA